MPRIKKISVKAKSVKAKSVKAKSVKAKSVKAKPVKAKPVKAKSVKPVKAKPVKPVKAKPVKPVKAKPVKAKPVKAKPVKAKPVKAKSVKAKSVKAKPVKAKLKNQTRVLRTGAAAPSKKKKKQQPKRSRSQEYFFVGGAGQLPVDRVSQVPPLQQWDSPDVAAPAPEHNGGLYTGAPFAGPWGNIPVTPTSANLTAQNLKSAEPPPGATEQYVTTNRLGNNYSAKPGTSWYEGAGANPGPFRMITTGGGATQKRRARRT